MATNTWIGGDSGNETDWATAANWSGGIPDDTDDIVIPDVTHDPIIAGTSTVTINSLRIVSGGRLTTGNRFFDIDGEAGNRCLDIDGEWTTTNTTVRLVTGADTEIAGNYGDSGGGVIPFNNLTIAPGASYTFTINTAGIAVAGDLTISAGELDTGSDRSLTVGGLTTVSANGTLTLNASDCGFNEGSGDAFFGLTIDEGLCDFGTATVNCGGLKLVGANAVTGTAATIIIDGFHTTGEVLNFADHTYDFGSGTTITASGGTTLMIPGGSTLNCKEFIISRNGSYGSYLNSPKTWTINGDFTIKNSSSWFTSYRTAQKTNSLICTGTMTIEDNSEYYSLTQYTGGGLADAPTDSFGSIKVDATSTFEGSSDITTITGCLRKEDIAGTFTLNGASWVFGGTGALYSGDLLKNEREVRINQERIFNFDGSDSNINCGSDSSLALASSDFTISLWFKTDTLGAGRLLFNQGAESDDNDDLHLQMRDSNILSLAFYGDDLNSTTTIVADKWYHVAATYNATSKLQSIYLDGVLDCSRTATAQFAGTAQTYIGRYWQDSSHWDGNIVDVRVYKEVLDGGTTTVGANTTGSLAKLASNMLVGVGAPNNWWKLNDETASGGGAGTGYVKDFGTANQQGTMDTLTWVYDAFGVDILDNTTTVSNLIVESGQLNTKGLISTHLVGTADQYIGSALTADQKNTRQTTFSCWFNADDVTGRGIAGRWTGSSQASETSLYLDSSSNLVCKMNSSDADGSGTYSSQSVTGSTVVTADKWHHVVAVASSVGDGNFLKIYLNGVLDGTNASYGKYIKSASDQFRIGWAWGATDQEFDGHMRDVRIYVGKALNADQVASLYRGSYNVTPECWFKMDAGTGTDYTAFPQSGLYTATSVSPAYVDSTWGNGSLKVNGAARVLDNGSVS